MTLDQRTPVIVGVGQINHPGTDAPEPTELLARAAEAAREDGGAHDALARLDSVRVVEIASWRYRDPGALVAARVGARPRHTAYSTGGGQTPQELLSQAAQDIQAGRADAVLIGGAESWPTRMAWHARGERPAWTRQPKELEPSERFGEELSMSSDEEIAIGLTVPLQAYPLFENALRHAAGRSVAAHTALIAELWSRFSEVAAGNPHAAIRRVASSEEIATPTRANRMVSSPYTKLLNANLSVNQAAAVLICSVAHARALGIPSERWVFPHCSASATEPFLSVRRELGASPAIRAVGADALRLAALTIDEVAHIDLYSCFPSAVQIAAAELGLPLSRQLTVTGGLTFAGGPWNNYTTHALAAMTEVLRADPGSYGLCTANGGLLSKHAIGIYSTRPPVGGFRATSSQAQADRAPRRTLRQDHAGSARVETYTVIHDRDGAPSEAFLAALTPEGHRVLCATRDSALLSELTERDPLGLTICVGADGALTIPNDAAAFEGGRERERVT